ncbi:MAG: hypothetical protein IPO92_13580 [Saprospiraceae bacterium]|nr:hypothetical protein [Saprospiraceae bacterium]
MKNVSLISIFALIFFQSFGQQILNNNTNNTLPSVLTPCPTHIITFTETVSVNPLVPPIIVVTDRDGDGIPDDIENAACTPSSVTCDTDGDGIFNADDLDSDGDGESDEFETANDDDGDGKVIL